MPLSINKFFVFLIGILFAVSLCAGCQSKKEREATPIKVNPEKDMQGIYEKVVKEREKRASKANQDSKENESKRKKQVAVAHACLEKYNSCLENSKSSSVDNTCFKALSVCEKDLPSNLKTTKEK